MSTDMHEIFCCQFPITCLEPLRSSPVRVTVHVVMMSKYLYQIHDINVVARVNSWGRRFVVD